ncbi:MULTISPECIES: histidine phosphatase family protein [unclassified Mesorhizobium]|jgi:broad specificity phosphatase PhoE|uniref:histidine phosphatase family protein n=1 Tax=unclassified Mesorhizobium TaxID=325217 RepID=UPI001129332E|nr:MULTISPECIES: histidine phosphatase family protein [unclassified Mesorhizobium]TPJ45460.1 histidine phosphatase family protein [Mesorhizobium sp. B2-6-6]MBZ9852967.1 histidine phosphatase family protein [Mesorhizobium sp. CA13]MBZ9964947.1 histidine phosphatase family protein [Mesorhizobium sp. BR1-1-2]MBZ9981802.1 histidine phosphatase family protein [Mesorhizobium sp. BR-1-1-8]MCA0002080.1 histidine phosphatase family protein [Mesorhizobium sp. B264B2A]
MYPLVYIVRHGQTAWNAEFRLQGQADTDINALGREQASANGHRLADLISNPAEFDFVASPMRRTRETMERIRAAMKLDPAAYGTDPRLVEVNFGDWQGFTFAELETQFPGASRTRALDKWNFQPPGKDAESYQMLLERVKPWFDALERQTVCVTHGGVMRTLFRFVLDMAEDDAAKLAIPQDRVLKLEGDSLGWL